MRGVCKKCGAESCRRLVTGGSYRYYCACENWKEMLCVLRHARIKDAKRVRK